MPHRKGAGSARGTLRLFSTVTGLSPDMSLRPTGPHVSSSQTLKLTDFHAHKHARTHAHTHAHTHARTHAHTHTPQTVLELGRVDGLRPGTFLPWPPHVSWACRRGPGMSWPTGQHLSRSAGLCPQPYCLSLSLSLAASASLYAPELAVAVPGAC
jgi:hypothetical protein